MNYEITNYENRRLGMINRIIKNFELIASAQTIKTQGRGIKADNRKLYGIEKLRELILDLAVQGKLLPQNQNDEPASELFRKISNEKQRLINTGKSKKQYPLSKINDNEKPYDIPKNWVWARIGEVGHDWGQKTPDNDFTYIEVSGIENNTGTVKSPSILSADKAPSRARKIVTVGTVIYSTVRPYLKNISVIDQEYVPEPIVSTAFAILHPYQNMPGKYFVYYFKSPIFVRYVESVQNGIAYPAINDRQFFTGLIPVPPLAEQHRIVAKVDELMVLCDQLEKEQTDSNAAHETLVETLLDTLTSACGLAELETAWQRISDHFELLFTTEYSIDRLKQTILQLAVMGKLVEQDTKDEPASELLKRIKKEKEKLVKEGKIKNQNHLPEIDNKIIPYELPIGWIWSRIGDISLSTEYGLSDMTFEGINGVPVLKMGDIQDGKALLGGQKIVPKNVEGLPSLYLKKGDLLYNRTNSAELVGKTGIFDGTDDEYTFASYLIRIRCSVNCVNPKYLNFSMNAPLFRITQIEPHLKQQCGQANVNGTILKNMIVPIPPSNEQQRIVAKVNELFGICDALKERIREAQGIERDLAEEMIEHGNVH